MLTFGLSMFVGADDLPVNFAFRPAPAPMPKFQITELFFPCFYEFRFGRRHAFLETRRILL